jgi:hypothetical protein
MLSLQRVKVAAIMAIAGSLCTLLGGSRGRTMARILAIDDEKDIRDLIKQGLVGHVVTTAPDGPKGLEEALRSPPDLV